MKAAIDWVTRNAGTGAYANVDASKIMAAGFSCGGVEAMDNIWDSRVDTVGVISSGLLSNYTAASNWRKPVLFVMGGQGDIAYNNVSYSHLYSFPSPALKLTCNLGRARLQEHRSWCSFLEGQHSCRPRWYTRRCEWRSLRQSYPQLDVVDHEGEYAGSIVLYQRVPG
jgi:hypothetical protein